MLPENPLTRITTALHGIESAIRGQKFSIVCSYSKTKRPFVQHAALLANDCDLKSECQVAVHHMGPPVGDSQNCYCHVLGQIGLTNEEMEAIEDWIASIATQYREIQILPFQQYVVSPHMTWVESELQRPMRQRFSCVGYVIEAYLAAEISLVDLVRLPDVEKKLLELAYPDLIRIAEKPELAKKLGLTQCL